MGWLTDLWEGVKSVASNVYNVVRKPVDWIAGAGDVIRKIPVIGSTLAGIASPVTSLAKTVQGGLDTAKQVADVAKTIGLKSGGVVKERMFQKAE